MGGSTISLLDLIESVKGWVDPIVLFSRKDSAYKAFEERGIKCIVSPFVKLHYFTQTSDWKSILRHPRRLRIIRLCLIERACVRQVKKYLGGRHVDIVVSNYSSILIGRELSIALKTKHVWHIREFLEPGVHVPNPPFGGYAFLKAMINRADARVFSSHQALKHWGLKQKNSRVIFDAVAKAEDCCYYPEKEPFILFCSQHITEAKGAFFVANAYGKSALFKDGIRLMYVGDCSDEVYTEIIDTARSYGCADSIDFVPCQDDVKPFFSHAKAFIMASTNEGLGRVTAEAMFYGCPVTAKNSGGTKDLIQDQITGYLFNTEDECSALLRRVCFHSQESLIRRAQEFVINNMSIEQYGPRIMDVYRSVL